MLHMYISILQGIPPAPAGKGLDPSISELPSDKSRNFPFLGQIDHDATLRGA